MSDLATILARLEADLGPLDGEPTLLEGGITNRNYRVTLGGDAYVVRLCDEEPGVLGIDRITEEIATRRAAADRIGPAVCAFLADEGVLVTRFLPGGGLTKAEVRSPGVLAQLAQALQRLHAGPTLPTPFAFLGFVDHQRDVLTHLARPYGDALALAGRIERALGDHPEHAPVPCHNNLMTPNFVRDGAQVMIIDWEYAGNNDRYFDLGNLSVNNDFTEADDRALLELYFDEPANDRRLAALQLMRLISDIREGVWGAVLAASSRLDFDYVAYAERHFARMERGAAAGDVDGWLSHAALA